MHQHLQALRSFWVDGVEETGSLKEARRRFVSECILQIAMIILVWLGVDDDGMIDVCVRNVFHVFFHRLRVRRVRCAVVGEPGWIAGEQMDM